MKKTLAILSLISISGWVHAVTNGTVAISSGTNFYMVDVSSVGTHIRQNVVIGDPNNSTGVAPVDPVTGLTVTLATSTASNIGNIGNTGFNATVTNSTFSLVNTATVTFNGVSQPVTATISGTPTVLLSSTGVSASTVAASVINFPATQAVTQSGSWTVSPGTGTYPITGSISNTSFQATQPVDSTLNASVSIKGSSNTVQITGTPNVSVTNIPTVVSTSAVAFASATVNLATNITAGINYLTETTTGTLRTDLSTMGGTTLTLNGDGGIPVHLINGGSGGTSSNFTAAFPSVGTAVGGVGPTGLMQSFRVDASSNLYVYIASTQSAGGGSSSWDALTVVPTSATPAGFVNATGNLQLPAVDASSNVLVNIKVGNVAVNTSTNDIGKVLYSTGTTVPFSSATINTSSVNTILVSTVSNQSVRVYRMYFTVSAGTTISLHNGNNFSYTGFMTFNAAGSFILDFLGTPWYITDPSTSFELQQTGSAQVSGHIDYQQN